jgi:hypothetical protein
MTPEIALINSIRTLLKADGATGALVGQNVFDQIPSQQQPPYVYIGPAGRTRIVMDCYQVWTVRVRLYAISTGYGRGEDWEIAEAMIQALDLQDLALADPYFQQEPLKITQAGDVIDPTAPKSVFVDISTTIAKSYTTEAFVSQTTAVPSQTSATAVRVSASANQTVGQPAQT